MPGIRGRLPPLSALAPFEAACRHASFSRAAAELSLTQAAISRQIRSLERTLGVRLFERQRHGVALTPAGAQFHAQIGPALNAIVAAADQARHAGRSHRSLVVFSDLALAGSFVIPRLGSFKRDHPELEIRLFTSSELMETVVEPFDVGLRTGAISGETFDIVSICPEEIFPVASPEFRHHLPRRLDAKSLLQMPLLHFSQSGRSWADWPRFLSAFGVNAPLPAGGLTFTSYSVLLDAAEAGHGVALGWGLSVENRLKQRALVRVTDCVLPLEHGLSACLPRRAPPSAAALQFVAWLKASM